MLRSPVSQGFLRSRLRKPFWLVLIVLLLGTTGSVYAQSTAIAFTPLTPSVEGIPGETVSLLFEAKNSGGASGQLTPQSGLFSGWQMVIPPESMTLASGEVRVVAFVVRVSPDATEGSYTFPVSYADHASQLPEFHFTVSVQRLNELEATLLRAPNLVIAEPYEVEFLVRNAGNGPQELDLTAADNLGLDLSVTPQTLSLAPGEAREVSVAVDVPATLTRTDEHTVRLRAQSRSDAAVNITALASVELVARTQSSASVFHTFPLRVKTSGSFDTNKLPGDIRTALDALDVEVSGTGSISDLDPGIFSVNLRNPLGSHDRKVFISYERPDVRFALGDQALVLSPLADAGTGFGLSARGSVMLNPNLVLEAKTFASTAARGYFGLTTAATFSGELTTSAQLLVDGGGVLVGGRLQYAPTPGEPSILLLRHFDVEYAGYRGTRVPFSSAWRLRGVLGEGPFRVNAGYSHIGLGFRDAELGSYAFDVTGKLSIDEALQLEDGPPISVSAWVKRAGTYSVAEPNAAATDSSTFRFGAALAATVGQVPMALSYDNALETDVSGGDRLETELRFGVRVPLSSSFSLQQSAGWTHEREPGTNSGAPSDTLTYSVQANFPLLEGRFSSGLKASYALHQQAVSRLEVSGNWSGPLTDAATLRLGATFHLTGDEALQVAAAGAYQLEGGRELELDVKSQFYRNRDPALQLKLGYSFPLHVTLGRLSTIGEVSGRIIDEHGVGLPGMVVQLGSLSTATGPDGRFHFPAVPEGELYLTVHPRSLPAGRLTAPALPMRLAVVAGAVLEVQVQLIRTAAVSGQVSLALPDDESSTGNDSGAYVLGAGESEGAAGLVAGLVVVLESGETVHRSVTDGQGRFAFESLPPGVWQLSIGRGSDADLFRLEPETQLLTLRPGETEAVTVDLTPVTRKVQIIEGGRLGND